MIKFTMRGDRIDLADELQEEFVGSARDALTDAGKILLAKSHEMIERTGRNAPAPPGETPATVTGDLKKGTKRLPTRVRGRFASSGVSYPFPAHLLEFGHDNADGTRTLPRPFIARSQEAAEAPIDALLRERLG